jgi:hypothetical protein
MTTKPPLQNIFQGILHTSNESKESHERAGNTKLQGTFFKIYHILGHKASLSKYKK